MKTACQAMFVTILFLVRGSQVYAQSLLEPALVGGFYKERQQALYWFAPDTASASLRGAFFSILDSVADHGLDSGRYHLKELREWDGSPAAGVTRGLREQDEWFTDGVIACFRALRSGAGIYEQVSYDGVTPSIEEEEDRNLLARLAKVRTAGQLKELARDLTPGTAAYDTLKLALLQARAAGDSGKCAALVTALNIYRWIHHHAFPRYMVVNIAAANLCYYERDSLRLQMKVVVGRPSTRTPRFAAWCDQLILYPYWNVPRKIAVNEFLPLFRKSPALVATMNMQLLDGRGRIIDPLGLDWSRYTKNNFPYALRQSTGCDNALGVIKFNLTSPYDVYMHDTNLKQAFRSDHRYYSHGCIRLEKPLELAVALLDGKLDTAMLAAGLKDQQPHPLRLEKAVPVFVVYLPADIEAGAEGRLAWYGDVYHLLK